MKFQFENGEQVQYESPKFGRGKGAVVGFVETSGDYIIYPKTMLPRSDYPFMVIVCKPKELISIPF